MQLETLIYEKRGPICVITMNRPEVFNAYDKKMVDELRLVWADYRDDDNLRAAVLTATGDKSFSTGLDAKEVVLKPVISQSMSDMGVVTLTNRDYNIWKPVIAAVNGVCCAGGWHFIADADVVICSDNATFFDVHTRIGIINPEESVDMMSKIPAGEVMRMVLCGGDYRMTAQRAYDVGLVSEVVPVDKLVSTAIAIAEQIAEKSPESVQGSLEVMWNALQNQRVPYYPMGMALLYRNFYSKDREEGLRAFVEKRQPIWPSLKVRKAKELPTDWT